MRIWTREQRSLAWAPAGGPGTLVPEIIGTDFGSNRKLIKGVKQAGETTSRHATQCRCGSEIAPPAAGCEIQGVQVVVVGAGTPSRGARKHPVSGHDV